ncbi:complex I NDUFA9 subunit family protein [Novosphingobium sp. TH158]|uniref:complex I NDUFA9 subunit family protein n=1 Tax=Novosphingobium sp. TH158 TaxID=2067455 RepID=UPI000C7E1C2A|nr:complex I NDUFA9 subunit family protein [Novosphingobium sp. TH158]PLK26883.1 complex I NDUFA9 subunit family protein [Novosphingobium sp. TH158]
MTTSEGNLAGKLVVLVGGSGFFGAHVAQELLSRGARLRVVCRNPKKAFRLKPLANLGQIQFVRADLTDRAVLPAVVADADAVVNLVGAFGGDLDAVHVHGPAALAKAAGEAGAEAFVHISALGCDAESEVDYARTKAAGEAAVLAAFPKATILRPSIIFGSDDNFITMFARLISRLPVLPVFGPDAKLQPVFVDDAAHAVANALTNPGKHGGKTYDVAGPEVITMGELNRRIAKAQGRKPLFADLPDAVSGMIATCTGWLPGAPISSDQWKLLKAGNVAGKGPGLKELGVAPRPLSLFLDRWMVAYRKHGRFSDKRGLA